MPESFIGMMSGSSLDGLDMALCTLAEAQGNIDWQLNTFQTIPFPEQIQNNLKAAPSLSGRDLMKLDADFGRYIGSEVRKWCSSLSFKPDYIASHGHTIFHEPASGFTTQIGSGAHIAFASGIDTITTFRSADVAAGGQGAPFAPAADHILFPGYEGYLNLGGIVNINLQTKDGDWKAWDIGPCNQALNFLAEKTGHRFDEDGRIAAKGNKRQDVIDHLLSMFKFNQGRPKGLSNTDVQLSWIRYLEQSKENVQDLLASTTEAIAQMVVHHIQPIIQTPSKLFITGGGAHHRLLMQRIETMVAEIGVSVQLPSKSIIDFKECLLMAYLGYLTVHHLPYHISPLTGASAETIGGALFKANP